MHAILGRLSTWCMENIGPAAIAVFNTGQIDASQRPTLSDLLSESL
jgi:hypothetical protein